MFEVNESSEIRNSLLEAIVDSSADAIVSKDLNGIVILWNPGAERLFGYTAAEMIGRHISVLIPPELLSEEEEIISKIARDQQIRHYETRRVRKDGRMIHVSLSISPVKNARGQVVGASKIARDISYEKECLEEREDFVAALVHDLKNPLIGAAKTLELVADGATGEVSGECRDVLFSLRDSNLRLLSRVQNLLDVYRLDKDIHALEFNRCDLCSIVSSTVSEHIPLARSKGVSIYSECMESPIFVSGDENALCRVLQNLINNALKFTPAGGTIGISAKVESGLAVVEVRDTGPGIAIGDQGALFQRFGQGILGRRHAPGTGLGLYLCKKIVATHGGEISCISEPGSGAVFRVELPAVPSSCRQDTSHWRHPTVC